MSILRHPVPTEDWPSADFQFALHIRWRENLSESWVRTQPPTSTKEPSMAVPYWREESSVEEVDKRRPQATGAKRLRRLLDLNLSRSPRGQQVQNLAQAIAGHFFKRPNRIILDCLEPVSCS
jgi:hypothetical protein